MDPINASIGLIFIALLLGSTIIGRAGDDDALKEIIFNYVLEVAPPAIKITAGT